MHKNVPKCFSFLRHIYNGSITTLQNDTRSSQPLNRVAVDQMSFRELPFDIEAVWLTSLVIKCGSRQSGLTLRCAAARP